MDTKVKATLIGGVTLAALAALLSQLTAPTCPAPTSISCSYMTMSIAI